VSITSEMMLKGYPDQDPPRVGLIQHAQVPKPKF